MMEERRMAVDEMVDKEREKWITDRHEELEADDGEMRECRVKVIGQEKQRENDETRQQLETNVSEWEQKCV